MQRFLNKRKALAALVALLLPVAFVSGCEATKAGPKLAGTLFFHSYSGYDNWDGHIFMLDLASRHLGDLTKRWTGVKHTINASVSPDGQYLTFMGSQTNLEDWDVFVSHWTGSFWDEPRNLTGPNGKRDEDPKFSPVAMKIIYKESGVLATIGLEGQPSYLTKGQPESSMPYFLPNGKDFLFEQNGSILLSRSGKQVEMYAGVGKSSYYPIAVDDKTFLYTRTQSSNYDSVMLGYLNGSPSKTYFFNSKTYDCSDPFPYQDGKNFLFYVTTSPTVLKAGYNLMLADLKNKQVFDLDSLYKGVNTDNEELGPFWTDHIYR